jgi:hypothetical protein
MKGTVVVMAVGLLGWVGCGDKSPAEKCDDLVSLICDRAVDCIAGASGMHAECVHAFDQVMLCENTKSVGPSYDRCLDQLEAQSCQALFPTDPDTGEQTLTLPVDCESVLSTESARGELEPILQVNTPFDRALHGMASALAQ